MLERLGAIVRWKRAGERAPHKPLLLLYALRECRLRGRRFLPYAEVHDALTTLLAQFDAARTRLQPNYPFWRLQNDGIWVVIPSEGLKVSAQGDVSPRDLIAARAVGGLTDEVWDLLVRSPELRSEAGRLLISAIPMDEAEPLLATLLFEL